MPESKLQLPDELLDILTVEMQKLGLDFFIVGAIARDINLSVNAEFLSRRATEDLDIAIKVAYIEQFQVLIQQLFETGDFIQIASNPIKLLFRKAVELDLMPFGEIETEKREVHIPIPGKSFILSVSGLEEVRELVMEMTLPSGRSIYYCPLEGIVLLKLISWYEKPERTKDADDIAHVCDVYFDYMGDEIYEAAFDLLHLYDTNDQAYKKLVASHYLGRKVREISKKNPMILEIINKKLERYDGLFRALLDGINETTPPIT